MKDKVILEIRSAEGGNDAKLLTETLENMYIKACKRKDYMVKVIHRLKAEMGCSEIVLSIMGEGAYS